MRYRVPPILRVTYIGIIWVTVSRNWNFNWPSSVKVFHICAWAKPAQYNGTAYSTIPMVPSQKWLVANFFEYSGVPHIRGTSQYNIPNAIKPFQPKPPICTWAIVQSVKCEMAFTFFRDNIGPS